MRNAFAAELTELAAADERIVLLTGDIGNRLFDPFKERNPGRFFNCGVAEANMTGVAAGLALCGLRPVTYTITPFNTFRCLEQIKLDVCYQNLPVIMVGLGAGLSYAEQGPTHTSCEDLACLRALPNLTIVCPGDAREVVWSLRAALEHPGPVYLRLGKKNEPVVHHADPGFALGRGIEMVRGDDVCLLVTGNLLPLALDTARELNLQGVSTGVVSLHTVKPLDQELLEEVFERSRLVVSLEEHGLAGGLGGALAEWLVDGPPRPARLLRCGTPDRFLPEVESQAQAREYLELSPPAVAARVLRFLDNQLH